MNIIRKRFGLYVATILAITVVTAAIGIILWNSEVVQTIDSNDLETACHVWSLGPENAPIVIETFSDFT